MRDANRSDLKCHLNLSRVHASGSQCATFHSGPILYARIHNCCVFNTDTWRKNNLISRV